MQDSMSWKEKREMRLRYNAEADSYDELYSDEQRMKYELAFRRTVFSGEHRILDCRCGTGMFLEKVAGSVQFAVGVDLSSKMLETARLRLGQISNVDLVCAHIDFLPFSEGTFRHVFMFTVLPVIVQCCSGILSQALLGLWWCRVSLSIVCSGGFCSALSVLSVGVQIRSPAPLYPHTHENLFQGRFQCDFGRIV